MRNKLIIGTILFIAAFAAIIIALSSEYALVINTKGIIAHKELKLIILNVILMFIIAIPTYLVFIYMMFKYHQKNKQAEHDPDYSTTPLAQTIIWLIPTIIIAIMAPFTWYATYDLDPYQPLNVDQKSIPIQVVAIDWKWLFIYPEQGIATVNFVQFPAATPIHFQHAADGSPMNSFWIPQLGGQIYSMTGMITPLHLMADKPGEFPGRAAEINGEGFADMTFIAKASTLPEFEDWVTQVKQSPLKLDDSNYNELLKPSVNHPVTLYSSVEPDLFNKIVMKYMQTKTKKP